MKQGPQEIAVAYASKWEDAWNSQGASAAAKLYTPDSVLVGAATGIGRPEIERLLGMLYQQGWTKISIKVLNAREVAGSYWLQVNSPLSAPGRTRERL
jgi:uncharacterized protein (TIGR02246 family)